MELQSGYTMSKSATGRTSKNSLASKRRLLAALLVERGLMLQKEAILSPYNVERIRDLSAPQLDELINAIKPMERKRDTPKPIRDARSVILGLLDDMGIKPKNGNWDTVNGYLKQPRIAGKVLYEMDLEELKACAVRLRQVKRWKEDKIEAENELAKLN